MKLSDKQIRELAKDSYYEYVSEAMDELLIRRQLHLFSEYRHQGICSAGAMSLKAKADKHCTCGLSALLKELEGV